MLDPQFEAKRLKGLTGEKIVAEVLQAMGYAIIPCYDYTGDEGNKAPKLLGENASWVLPDLLAAKDGKTIFVEVKHKASATFTRMTGQFEHGVSSRHVSNYRDVARITGSPVYVAILEASTGDILFQSLDKLNENARYYNGHGMDHEGMTFWRRDAFEVLANVKDDKAS